MSHPSEQIFPTLDATLKNSRSYDNDSPKRNIKVIGLFKLKKFL